MQVLYLVCIGFKKPRLVMHVPNLIWPWEMERFEFFPSLIVVNARNSTISSMISLFKKKKHVAKKGPWSKKKFLYCVKFNLVGPFNEFPSTSAYA